MSNNTAQRQALVALATAALLSVLSCASGAPSYPPLDSSACKASDACKQHGECHATYSGGCVVTSTADCRAAGDCKALGLCTAVTDTASGAQVCLAGSDTECSASDACKSKQLCMVLHGKCVSGDEVSKLCDTLCHPGKGEECCYGNGTCVAVKMDMCGK